MGHAGLVHIVWEGVWASHISAQTVRDEQSTNVVGSTYEAHQCDRARTRVLAKRRHGMVGINAWGGPAGHQGGTERHKAAMGIDWMTGDELTQAVPPAFTEFIGTQLLEVIEGQ